MYLESDGNITGTEIQHLGESKASSSGNDLEVDLGKGDDLKVFSYSSIIAATNDFSSENKLGQGGFGSVFKVSQFLNFGMYVIYVFFTGFLLKD